MLVDITFDEKYIDEVKKLCSKNPELGSWEELLEGMAPWLYEGHGDCHPGVGQYCSAHLNFPSYAFLETQDKSQKELEFFPEQEPYMWDEKGELVKNPSYVGTAYGLADNFEQILEFVKPYIDSPNSYIIWTCPEWYDKDCENSYGGFRPYKWGKYIGKYKDEIDSHEYYNDCEFPEDYQGYLLIFHIIKIKEVE